MSWQGYIDNLIAGGHIASAAIIGYPDGQIWAASPGFNMNPREIQMIVAGFGNDKLAGTGILANNTKYIYLQSEEHAIQGKKSQCGISIAKGQKCMIVGTYADGHQPGNARKAVGAMVDYLKDNGY